MDGTTRLYVSPKTGLEVRSFYDSANKLVSKCVTFPKGSVLKKAGIDDIILDVYDDGSKHLKMFSNGKIVQRSNSYENFTRMKSVIKFLKKLPGLGLRIVR